MPGQDFALNHMVAPRKSLPAFMELARSLGVDQIEIRNDLSGQAITDGTPPEKVRAAAEQAGLSIASINALQRFNQWTPARAEEAAELVAYAKACGAKALVLCPVNDESFRPTPAERLAGLREALTALKPMLRRAGSRRSRRTARLCGMFAAAQARSGRCHRGGRRKRYVQARPRHLPSSCRGRDRDLSGLDRPRPHLGRDRPCGGCRPHARPAPDAGRRAGPSRQCRSGARPEGGRLPRPDLV